MSALSIGCVLLAAGNSSRFGCNKLDCEFRGKTLIQRAMDAIPADTFSETAVVTQYPEIANLAREHRFFTVINSRPDLGQSHSIHLGLDTLRDCTAVMFMVADQPCLTAESVGSLVKFYRQHPDHIVALGHNGVRGNPCIFPARFFSELMEIRGDCGGNVVIRRHEDDLLLWDVAPAQLSDIDTPSALKALE